MEELGAEGRGLGLEVEQVDGAVDLVAGRVEEVAEGAKLPVRQGTGHDAGNADGEGGEREHGEGGGTVSGTGTKTARDADHGTRLSECGLLIVARMGSDVIRVTIGCGEIGPTIR